MSFAEDVTDFLDTLEFADAAIVAGSTVNGIFDREYVEVNEVDSMRPTLYCAWDDVSSASQGDTVAVNGENFTILDIQREDIFCLLVLHNA